MDIAATKSDRPTRYSWIIFALTYALMASDYMSRQVMNAVFPIIKTAWALSDTQLGALVSIVALTVGVAIIPISLLVDRVGRVKSITVMALVWALSTMACGLSGNFGAMFAARGALGLGEAGYGSAGGAILLRVFPSRLHSTVLGIFLSGSLFGSVLGLLVGGGLAKHLGWQMAFILVGVGGLVVALIYPLVVKEPAARSEPSAARLPLMQVARAVLAKRTMICTYLGLATNMFVQAALIAWAPSYLNRYYGMDVAAASKGAGFLALASGVGMMAGGYLVDRLGGRDLRNRLRLPALFVLCSGIALVVAFQCPPGALQIALIGVGLMVGNFVIGSAGAVVTDLAPVAIHATALAVISVSMNLLGSAPGPVMTGWIADHSSLRTALAIVPLLCFVSAAAFATGARFYEQDRSPTQP